MMLKKKLKNEELEKLKQELEEATSKWKRALADYQNLEKRTQNQQSTFLRLANAGMLKEILPMVDDLRRAAKHINDQGLHMVVGQFDSFLKNAGLQQIEVIGQKYDPKTMECIETKEGEKDLVIEVLENGYTLNDYVVRPAKVLVGKG